MRNIHSNNAQGNAPGLDAAMRRDRIFFRRHPFLQKYCRELMPGEFPTSIFPLPPLGYKLQGLVEVTRICANLRKRAVLTAIVVPEHD